MCVCVCVCVCGFFLEGREGGEERNIKAGNFALEGKDAGVQVWKRRRLRVDDAWVMRGGVSK